MAVFRASRLGDFLCATPAFRSLRAALPEADITLIGLPFVHDLVARSPSLDRFEPFPGYPGIAEQFFVPADALHFFTRMQAERFDLVIQLHGTGVYANPVALMLGGGRTAGLIRPGDDLGLLDAAFPMPPTGHHVHRLQAFMAFLGAPPLGVAYDFPLSLEDRLDADALLAHSPKPLIGIHAGSWEVTKRWPGKRFAAVALALRRRYGGTVVLIGAGNTASTGDEIESMLGSSCLNLVDRTSLGVLGAVIHRFTVLITNDSGPAHIAHALRTPSVTVFRATAPEEWGALDSHHHAAVLHDVDSRPCPHTECRIGNRCLDGVMPAEVIAAAERVIERHH